MHVPFVPFVDRPADRCQCAVQLHDRRRIHPISLGIGHLPCYGCMVFRAFADKEPPEFNDSGRNGRVSLEERRDFWLLVLEKRDAGLNVSTLLNILWVQGFWRVESVLCLGLVHKLRHAWRGRFSTKIPLPFVTFDFIFGFCCVTLFFPHFQCISAPHRSLLYPFWDHVTLDFSRTYHPPTRSSRVTQFMNEPLCQPYVGSSFSCLFVRKWLWTV